MATEAVFKYLTLTNRPYSANDIMLNLHKEYGKTAIQKALDELVSSQRIFEKTYGKQKVYCALQTSGSLTEADVSQLDEQIKEKSKLVDELEKAVRDAEFQLKELLNQPSTEDANKENDQLEQSNGVMRNRLESLKAGNVQLVSVEERKAAVAKLQKVSLQQKKIKRTALDILDAILEGYPNSKDELYEEIGVEPDP